MPFAYRSHKAFVNLDPGGSMHFRLPLMTQGQLVIKAQHIGIGGPDQPGDHPQGGAPQPSVDWDRVHDLLDLRRRGRIETGARASYRRREPLHPTSADGGLDPEVGGGVGAATDLTLELYYGDQLAQRKEHGANVFYPVGGSDGVWTLKITRASDGSVERRRYRIDAQYPSVLPLLPRRIPLQFLRSGFDQNWNDGHQYLEAFWIENNIINWRWDAKLSALYRMERERSYDLNHRTLFELPTILKRDVRFGVGFEDGIVIAPATSAPKVPYFFLKIDAYCKDSRIIDVFGPDNITLPAEFSLELRIRIRNTQGILLFDPKIIIPSGIEDDIMGFDLDLPGYLRDFERQIYMWQWESGGNKLDRILRPWLVGDYEVVEVEADEADDQIVLWYVGRPIPQELTASSGGGSGGGAPPDLPALFADAEDERWLPPAGLGGPIGPMGQAVPPGDLAKIDHIVILMQENRSFDQVLGHLSRHGIDPNVEGLLPGDNPRDVNEYRRTSENAARKYRSTQAADTSWPFALDNPCHGHDCVVRQIADGMKSFVRDYAHRLGADAPVADLQRIMNYYGPGQLPAYDALARSFAICDHWFSSHIGGTLPNRHITFSGDLNRDRFGSPEEDNSDFNGYPPSERLTFFDHLTKRGVSWKLFEHGYSFLRLYRNYTFDLDNIVGFKDPDRGFEELARRGTLPAVSFIEPDYIELPGGNDDHAPADMWDGQRLVAQVVRALIRSPAWPKTLLIITYDEHGGFYDHMVPPETVPVTQADGTVVQRPIPALSNSIKQLGVRVPAFVISPFTAGGAAPTVNVSKTVYEHASIPATVLRRFCGPRTPKMSPRTTAANDVRDLLSLPAPRLAPEFQDLLAELDRIADSPPTTSSLGPTPVPTRKVTADEDPEEFGQDFHGFIAYASTITGRAPRF